MSVSTAPRALPRPLKIGVGGPVGSGKTALVERLSRLLRDRYDMRSVHLTPEQAVQAAQDVGARITLGIHWGTFDLAEEPLGEPPTRMLAETTRRGIGPERAWILKIGETRRW